ncbi:MAG: sodium:solute symporter [Wenzhouxiangellaceae bacterium]
MSPFATLDWMVLSLYFLMVFGVAFLSGWRDRKGDTESYFLAGKNVGWFVIGASIFASNIGSEHLVGLAGAGASGGVPVAQFEIIAAFALLLLGWLFVPFYLASGVFTMPEFLERRYSSGPRFYLAIISIIGYVLTKISVTIAAGGLVFETLIGIDFWTGAVIVVVATGIYTLWGGLRAVLYTDLLQMFILIGGSLVLTWIGLDRVGGWQGLQQSLDADYFSLWRSIDHPEFPWTGILFGAPILAVWYWCTDQFIVQRALSARGIDEARRGALFAAYLKQLPLFIFVLPGMIAMALVRQGQMELGEADQALPALVGALLPAGLTGLVAAGLLAALMSSLSSVFNSCSTIFTIDIYQKLRPAADQRRLLLVGRLGVLAMVVFGLLWIPFMDLVSGQLFTYIQSVQAYIAPPVAVVFLIGLLWRGANARGAVATLIAGFVLGIGRLLLEINQTSLPPALAWFSEVNFLHFALLLFVFCSAVLVGVSLLSGGSERGVLLSQQAHQQVLATRDPGRVRHDRILSVVLIVIIAGLWALFSSWFLGS